VKRMKRLVKSTLSNWINSILGQRPWPVGQPLVTQGFAGEPITEPIGDAGAPLISVIMPVFNACRINRAFLQRALESIANQTYAHIELVIVDDGSTDDTRAVCQEFLSNHPSLNGRFLSKENAGQSSARNFGVKACNGEYIGFIDQDDEWYENKLERVVPWLSNNNIDVLYTDAETIDGDDNVLIERIHQNLHAGWPHPKNTIEDILFKDIFVMPGLMTIRRNAFERVGGFDEQLSGYEDDDLFLRLFETSRVFYLPIPTLRWRMYGENYSFSHRMLTSRTYFWRKLLKNYTDHGANRYRVHMISLRFFWQFMGQSKAQYLANNELCWKSFRGAKEFLPQLPFVQRMFFSILFLFPDQWVLPRLVQINHVIRF
jgi:glycosyltransferase involved in cell wall biosynthesis